MTDANGYWFLPAGLRINHTKGLSMKKIMAMALALMAAAVLATGCAGIGAPGKGTPVENSVMIEKDGNVQWASVETYDKGDYTEEELKAFVQQRISDFNSSLGKAAKSENTEGAEKLPAALVSAKIGDGKAFTVTEYDTASRIIEFAREIGDYNVTFTALEAGRVAVLGQGLEDVAFKDVKGNAVDASQAVSDGQQVLVKAEGPGVIKTEKKILYVSDGCSLRDSNTVETPEEGASYIILD